MYVELLPEKEKEIEPQCRNIKKTTSQVFPFWFEFFKSFCLWFIIIITAVNTSTGFPCNMAGNVLLWPRGYMPLWSGKIIIKIINSREAPFIYHIQLVVSNKLPPICCNYIPNSYFTCGIQKSKFGMRMIDSVY